MKSISIKNETIIFIFVLILPLTLLFGTLVSEITIFLIGTFFLIKFYQKKEWHWIKSIELKLLILIWFYLILNSILANSTSLALSRGLFFLGLYC